jgi:FtsH-binding integral membrane protein
MPIDLNSMRNPPRIQAQADTGLREYFRSIYTYMTLALALTGLVAWFAYDSGLYFQIARTPMIWVVMFAPLAVVLFLGFRIQQMSLGAAQAAYWVYSALVGLSLAGVFAVYSGQSIARVFFITAGTFGGMSLYGYATKTDLTRMGNFMIMGLWGIIIASLVNIFLKSSALQFAVSVIGVIVFTGLTAYDTQKLKEMYYQVGQSDMRGKVIIMGALNLYLDFINLFMMLLRLFGDRRN